MKIKTNLQIIKSKYFYFVPFITLAFLLFIFMTLSSSFVQLSAINIELPHVIGQPISTEKLVITIDKNENYYFNDEVMSLSALTEKLATISSKYQIDSVIIRADKNTPQGAVAKILALANSLNLNVYLAVDPVQSSPQIPIEKSN